MVIKVTDYVNEAASKNKGQEFLPILEKAVKEYSPSDISIDFSGISRYASQFFNNSFAALAMKLGFETVESIRLINIGEAGQKVYQTSIDNAKALASSTLSNDEVDNIVSAFPRKSQYAEM